MTSTNGLEALDFRPSLRQTMYITPTSAETEGRISRVVIELEGRQGGPPAHVHPGQREIYTVEAGELTVTLDGDRRIVGAGESVEVAPGQVHTFSNPSSELVRFRADHLPALGFEEYIRLVHRTIGGRKPTLPTIMRIVRIESSYADTIVAPPGPPRVVGKILSGLGRLAGFPTGAALAASLAPEQDPTPEAAHPHG